MWDPLGSLPTKRVVVLEVVLVWLNPWFDRTKVGAVDLHRPCGASSLAPNSGSKSLQLFSWQSNPCATPINNRGGGKNEDTLHHSSLVLTLLHLSFRLRRGLVLPR
jgi:hypothetical protein